MTLEVDRRIQHDRRNQAKFNFRFLIGKGKRQAIRRQEDEARIFVVDQFSQSLFLPILLILFLSVIDALLTLFLLGNGAYEANPVMAYFLKFGPYIFFTVKYTLTSLGLIALLIFRNRIFKAIKVSASALLYIFACIFFTVVIWQIYMVSKIVS